MLAKIMLLALLLGLGLWFWRRWQRRARLDYVSNQALPRSLTAQLKAQYPDWGERQLQSVESGLRQFFRLCAQAPGSFVAMPSKAVDAAWHAFILDTRAYQRYCKAAFGRMLHHTPAEALPEGKARPQLQAGLRRAWFGACHDEGLDPRRTTQLPLLFALDAQLAIPGGYRYVPDCRLLGADRGDTHCAAALACGGSSDDGYGSNSSSTSSSSSSNDGRCDADGDGGGGGGGSDGGGDGGGGGCGGGGD